MMERDHENLSLYFSEEKAAANNHSVRVHSASNIIHSGFWSAVFSFLNRMYRPLCICYFMQSLNLCSSNYMFIPQNKAADL